MKIKIKFYKDKMKKVGRKRLLKEIYHIVRSQRVHQQRPVRNKDKETNKEMARTRKENDRSEQSEKIETVD